MRSLDEEDAILVSDPKRIIKGRAAILDGLINFLSIKPRLTLNASRVVRNGGLAILYSDWTIVGRNPDGSSMSVDVRPTHIARQQPDGAWCIVIDDPSVEDPAPKS